MRPWVWLTKTLATIVCLLTSNDLRGSIIHVPSRQKQTLTGNVTSVLDGMTVVRNGPSPHRTIAPPDHRLTGPSPHRTIIPPDHHRPTRPSPHRTVASRDHRLTGPSHNRTITTTDHLHRTIATGPSPHRTITSPDHHPTGPSPHRTITSPNHRPTGPSCVCVCVLHPAPVHRLYT